MLLNLQHSERHSDGVRQAGGGAYPGEPAAAAPVHHQTGVTLHRALQGQVGAPPGVSARGRLQDGDGLSSHGGRLDAGPQQLHRLRGRVAGQAAGAVTGLGAWGGIELVQVR